MPDETRSVSVLCKVVPDENGYPDVDREQLWCLDLDSGSYVVDNIPFYARDISLGDEIEVTDKDGELWFSRVRTPSRNTTIRVFARAGQSADEIVRVIKSFGGELERMEGTTLMAVSFAPNTDLAEALEYLDNSADAGTLGFEESSVRYK